MNGATMRVAGVMLTMAALVGTPSFASAQRDGDERKGDEPAQREPPARPSDPRAPERRPSDPRAPERRDAERRRMRSRFHFDLRFPRRERWEDDCMWSEFIIYRQGRYVIVRGCVDVYGQFYGQY